MKHRSLPAAAAFAAPGVLFLTACGGGDDESKGNDKIAGTDTGSETSASPSANTSARNSTERPKIELPSDVTDKFASWKTGDTATVRHRIGRFNTSGVGDLHTPGGRLQGSMPGPVPA